MTPDQILTWWDVVDRIGLVGVLLLIVFFIGYFIYKKTPQFFEYYSRHIIALEKQNEHSERQNEQYDLIEKMFKEHSHDNHPEGL